jgi:hypothetical protein
MKFLLSFVVLFSMNSVFSAEEIRKVKNPIEIKEESVYSAENVPKEIAGLQWNRWTSKNFVVLALNDSYAKYLNEHLELVKTWTLGRWGLLDIEFSSQCKFIVVDDPVLFDKLFKLKKTKVEIRLDDQGKIKETVIFLLADDVPSHSVPSPVTDVCLAEFGQKYNVKFGAWVFRGMSLLNGPLDQISNRIINIKNPIESNEPLYFSKGLLELTKKDYAKLSEDQKVLFDSSAVIFCLLIRKEFGQEIFHSMMKDSSINPEESLRKWLKFKSYDQFDKTFKRYMIDLSNDIVAKKTPDRYLQIYEPNKD